MARGRPAERNAVGDHTPGLAVIGDHRLAASWSTWKAPGLRHHEAAGGDWGAALGRGFER